MATSYFNTSDPAGVLVGDSQSQQQQHDKSMPRKRRSRNPENWLKTKRKHAILAGQSYVNTRGEVVSAKSVGPDCNCKNKCFLGVCEESRQNIFSGFYNLKSYDEQNSYLYGLIRRHDIQRKRQPYSDKRTCSYKYYVRIKGKQVQVCKKAFASIHGISEKKIRTLCLKLEDNVMFPRDNRGRHSNRPKKVTPEVVLMVKQHIVQVLSGPSAHDYVKSDKNQMPDINITKLHKNFLQLYEPEALDIETDKIIKNYDAKVKTWVYFKVFHEEFKSLDFNTVKRKLSDLRKTLEAAGALNNTKRKGGKTTKMNCKTEMEDVKENPASSSTMNTIFIDYPNFSLKSSKCAKRCIVTPNNYAPKVMAAAAPLPVTSVSNYNFVSAPTSQHSYVPHVAGQPCIYNFTGSQQQPLNLQVNPSGTVLQQSPLRPPSAQLLHHDMTKHENQQLQVSQSMPIAIPTNGQPYYLTISSIPNIITVPPSTCTTVINMSNRLSSPTNALITATLVGGPHNRPLDLPQHSSASVLTPLSNSPCSIATNQCQLSSILCSPGRHNTDITVSHENLEGAPVSMASQVAACFPNHAGVSQPTVFSPLPTLATIGASTHTVLQPACTAQQTQFPFQ